jgi:hypothetical protein
MTNTGFDPDCDADGALRVDMPATSRAALFKRGALLVGGGAAAITGVATALAQEAPAVEGRRPAHLAKRPCRDPQSPEARG